MCTIRGCQERLYARLDSRAWRVCLYHSPPHSSGARAVCVLCALAHERDAVRMATHSTHSLRVTGLERCLKCLLNVRSVWPEFALKVAFPNGGCCGRCRRGLPSRRQCNWRRWQRRRRRRRRRRRCHHTRRCLCGSAGRCAPYGILIVVTGAQVDLNCLTAGLSEPTARGRVLGEIGEIAICPLAGA